MSDPSYASAILTDSAGNVFVAGNVGPRMALSKYGADGTLKDYSLYFSFASPRAMLIDQSDNIVMAVDLWILDEHPAHRYTVAKFANDGTLLWTNVFSTPEYQGGNLPHVAIDPAGNVFATIGSANAEVGDADYTTVKLTGDGIPVWTSRFLYNTGGRAGFASSAMDNAGNYYLLCSATALDQSNNTDYVTLKLSPHGVPLWTNRFDLAAYEYAHDLAVDAEGSVVLTGMSGPNWSASDFVTIKYADYVLYSPPPGFVGSDSFSFTAVDSAGHATTGMVSVTVLPSPLRFNTSQLLLTPLGFRMQIEGSKTTNAVVLLASTNLIYWQPIATNPPTSSPFQFTDPAAANFPQRFYKAATVPASP